MIDIVLFGQTTIENLPAIPSEGGFFGIIKIIVMTIFLFLWAMPAAWCSRDAKRFSLNQFMWGAGILAAATFGWIFWFFIPMYILGLFFYILLAFGMMFVYAFYRDGLVDEKEKILNVENLMKAIKGGEEAKPDIIEKVRLATPQGREPKIPEDAEGQKIYQVVQDLLFDGLWRRANEILIQPAGENVRVWFKIDGVLSEVDEWERHWGQKVIDYTKQICMMNLEEHRQPQKSKLVAQQISVSRKVTLDIETAGSTAGEKMVIRVRAEEAKFTIEDIGFTDTQLDVFKDIMNKKNGLVILSGMPSTGVTSTMYALGRSLDAFTQNIHSVEIKPLMDLDNITQNIYQSGTEKDFPKLIQSISRREPDTMLVDPCLDPETAKMIAKIVADKKRMIFTTLRASSSISALGRILRWIDSPEISGEIILGVVFQRLVRKLCPACREAYKPNAEMLKKINFTSDGPAVFYRPPTQQQVDKKGQPIICTTCQGSGYMGRTGVFELLLVDDALREAIQSNDAVKIKSRAKKSVNKLWQDVAMEKIVAGVTSFQEVIRVSKEAEAADKKE